jgi:formylglycine-generating enzyme required for sulfatase activity
MRFVLIPAGTFTMGSPRTQWGRNENEAQRDVEIARAFYLAVTEVTNGQYRAFRPPHPAQRHLDGIALDADEQPACGVSVEEAEGFCAWLAERDGRAYRVPTEAEWEYACRAGTTTRSYWGDALDGLGRFENACERAAHAKWPSWNCLDSHDDGFAGPAPVASFLPNPWGLHDMLGNASEWTLEVPPAAAERSVLRGSAFDTNPDGYGCAIRRIVDTHGAWQLDTGVRLACDLPTPR